MKFMSKLDVGNWIKILNNKWRMNLVTNFVIYNFIKGKKYENISSSTSL